MASYFTSLPHELKKEVVAVALTQECDPFCIRDVRSTCVIFRTIVGEVLASEIDDLVDRCATLSRALLLAKVFYQKTFNYRVNPEEARVNPQGEKEGSHLLDAGEYTEWSEHVFRVYHDADEGIQKLVNATCKLIRVVARGIDRFGFHIGVRESLIAANGLCCFINGCGGRSHPLLDVRSTQFPSGRFLQTDPYDYTEFLHPARPYAWQFEWDVKLYDERIAENAERSKSVRVGLELDGSPFGYTELAFSAAIERFIALGVYGKEEHLRCRSYLGVFYRVGVSRITELQMDVFI